jgi:hypothetical protein
MPGIVTQILIDGPRNTTAKVTGDNPIGTLVTNQIILAPSSLSDMMPGMSGSHPATLLRVDYIDYSITDGVIAQFIWDATTPVIMCELYGRGRIDMKHYGGWQNPNGPGTTGNILLSTILGGATNPNNYSLLFVLSTVKFRPIAVGGA